ncbi:MAG: response regulator [Lachnospiraceae bacterium]|nr:response regulator [Candidatus Merdinaster equi]
MYINIVLIIISVLVSLMCVRFFQTEGLKNTYARYTLLIGLGAFLWTCGYGVMGFSANVGFAHAARIVANLGIETFVTATIFYLAEQVSKSKGRKIFLHIIMLALDVVDFRMITNLSTGDYVHFGGRTTYHITNNPLTVVHFLFIILVIIIVSIYSLIWYKRTSYVRERNYVRFIGLSAFLIILGYIPDIVMALFGMPSVSSSAVGAGAAFLIIIYITKRYNASRLTGANISHYVYNFSQSGIIAFNLELKVKEANPYARTLIGLSAVERDKGIEEIFEVSMEDRDKLIERLKSGEEVSFKAKASRTGIATMITLKEAYDEKHYPYMISCTVMDYSDEEKILEKLDVANQSKSEFLSNMSHEIRTPIHAILGLNEMIQRESKDERIQEYAENIDNSGAVLLSIISEILDVSKIENGTIEIQKKEYSLGSLIKDLILMSEDRAKKKDLKLNVSVDENLPDKLIGDDTRIRQIITNLLTNAIKYTDYGTIQLSVGMATKNSDSLELEVHVSDTGKGIKQEDIRRLFSAFERVDETKNRRIEGTGLGLAISSHLVKLMEGELKVSSEYGKGSDFYFSLPQQVVSWDKISKESYEAKRRKVQPEYHRLFIAPEARILAVDDNDTNLQVLGLLLGETGVTIDTCMSGAEALVKLKDNQYDLILLDHMMPGMDGLEVLSCIKQQHLTDAPVIVLTANAIAGAKDMYIEKGFTDYISKPIVGRELEEMLFKHLPKNLTIREEDQE